MLTENINTNNEGALGTPTDNNCQDTTIIFIENIYIDQGTQFMMIPPHEEVPDTDLFEVGSNFQY